MSIPVLLALLAVLPGARGQSAEELRAGVASVDITPAAPLRLLSTPPDMGPTVEIDQRLHARVLVLEDASGVASLLVSLDASTVPQALRERVCGHVRPRFGIYRVRIAVCATGAEATPILHGGIGLGATAEERSAAELYTNQLVDSILEAISAARADLRPVRLRLGRAPDPGEGSDGGPAAGWPFLALSRSDGSLAALVFGMTRPATSADRRANRISSGWPGRVVASLERSFPGARVLPLAGLDWAREPRSDESQRAARSLRDAMEKGGAPPANAPSPARLDCRFEYCTLDFDGGSLRLPVQLWSLTGGRRVLFLAGRADASLQGQVRTAGGADSLWVVGLANAPAGLLPSVRREDAPEALTPRDWSDAQRQAWLGQLGSFLSGAGADLAARVKPPGPLTPREALETFRLDPRLQIELAACEPQVSDPVAMAFDAAGALFVCEMHDYPLGPPGPAGSSEGRLRRLEDRDGDGFHEHASDYATGLPYINGVACHRGGVYVTAETRIVYLKDGDGDGRAEIRRTVIEGFRRGNSQHLVNTLQPGLDNWIYANGGDGASLRRGGVTAATVLELRHQSFRFHPDSLQIEATSGYRGGFGMAVNDRGARFVCDNQNHACEVVLPRWALLRNPELRSDLTMETIPETGSRVYPASRPLERFNDPFDVGRFSSACGVHVYGGDRLPPEYRGNIFTCEPVGNLVHREELRLEGARYHSRRVEAGSEFLASTDHWFRPVNVTTGPDGALYVCDMYREVIEHPQWIPVHVQKLFDLRNGHDRGRIYRVRSRKGARPEAIHLDAATTQELVGALGDPVSWRRRTAQRLLVEARDPKSAVELRQLIASESSVPLARVHALWTLDGLNELDAATLVRSLGDPSERVREQAARLAGKALGEGAAPEAPSRLVEALASLAGDPCAPVRFQAALALGNARSPRRLEALASLAGRDSGDAWTRRAILSSVAGDAVAFLRRILAADAAPSGAGLRSLAVETLDLISRRGNARDVYSAVAVLSGLRGDWPRRVAFRILEGLGPGGSLALIERAGGEGWLVPSGRDAAAVSKVLRRWFAEVEASLADSDLDVEARRDAMELVALAEPSRVRPALAPYVNNREPVTLQTTAIRGLAALPPPVADEVTALLLERLPALTPPVQREVLDAFLRSTSRVSALLDALESGALSPRLVSLAHRATLLEHPEPRLRERARRILADQAVTAERADVVREYRLALLDLPARGDVENGKKLFEKNCSSCHRVGGLGNAIGPDLVALASRERDALLLDILDPNRAVDSRYLNYLAILRDSRILNGLISSETASSVVFRLADGKTEVISRRDIRELRASGKSLMPEGLEQEIDPHQMVDLVSFLRDAAGLSR